MLLFVFAGVLIWLFGCVSVSVFVLIVGAGLVWVRYSCCLGVVLVGCFCGVGLGWVVGVCCCFVGVGFLFCLMMTGFLY